MPMSKYYKWPLKYVRHVLLNDVFGIYGHTGYKYGLEKGN